MGGNIAGARVSSPSSSEPRRDAVDRQEQRRQRVFLPRAVASQQLDLLVAHLIQRRQPAGEAFPELGEPLGERALAREAPHRSEEHTSELQSQSNLVCRLLLEKKK